MSIEQSSSPSKDKIYRVTTHRDTGGIQWGGLACQLNAIESETQKEYYYKDYKEQSDRKWPEPPATITQYVYYQTHNGVIGGNYDKCDEYNTLDAKLMKITSPNSDGSETLVFSLNESTTDDIAHIASHHLLGNLQAKLGIQNTFLYVDEIIIFSLQYGINIGNRPRNKRLEKFIENNFEQIQYSTKLTQAEFVILAFEVVELVKFLVKILSPKILAEDAQIVQRLEQETIRYEEYIEKLRQLQDSTNMQQILLEKVEAQGTWEIDYSGPIEGFKEFEFGEIPELTGDYSVEVAEINRLIDQIDDRIKFKGVSKLPTPKYMKNVPKNPQAGIDARSKNLTDAAKNLFSDSIK